ncbi:MAG: MFS transporter, partial [Chloroflexi bacterium]|nr:MFS transporter [Chloroflexota bacterium]
RTVAVNFFHRRRNLALGLQSMARPVAGAINIQVISLVAQGYSWRVAYRALGVFALALIVPMFLVMRRRPEDIGLRPDGDRLPDPGPATPATASTSVPGPLPSGQRDWRAREATATPTFWLIVAAEALIILTSGAIGFQTVPYLKDSGLSQTYAAVALSLASLLGALGNPAWGYLADRLSPRRLALFITLATALVTSLFLTIDSGRTAFAVMVVWGIASGGLTILGSMMLADYFGRSSFGTISGLMGPIQLGFLGLGPTFGAVLFSLTGGYTALFVYAVFAYLAAMLLIYSVRAPRPPRVAAIERIE